MSRSIPGIIRPYWAIAWAVIPPPAARPLPAARRFRRRSVLWWRPTSRPMPTDRHRQLVEEDFRRAVKQGIAPGGRRLYPAMPYPSYAKMSDQDVANLYAYMRSVEPVEHRAAPARLRFPYNIRALMAVWNWLYFKPAPTTARCREIRGLESRRRNRHRSRPLRRLSHPQDIPGRRYGGGADRRLAARLVRARHHRQCHTRRRRLERGGTGVLSEDRP